MDLTTAEQCLHDRSGLAFAAAETAGMPGRFRALEDSNLRALLTTSPDLGFLNTITGLDQQSLSALPQLLTTFSKAGAPTPALITGEATQKLQASLRRLGFTAAGRRPIAITDLPPPHRGNTPDSHHHDGELRFTEVRTEQETVMFLRVLLAGYATTVAVARFIAAEHRATHVHRFVAWRGKDPVAAAAMSVHQDVAVLGGAATLSASRGTGAQTALVHHRLQQAAAMSCVAATATAAPDSSSMRTLGRAGFALRSRQSWRQELPRFPA